MMRKGGIKKKILEILKTSKLRFKNIKFCLFLALMFIIKKNR